MAQSNISGPLNVTGNVSVGGAVTVTGKIIDGSAIDSISWAHASVASNAAAAAATGCHFRVPFAGNWREVLNTDAAVYGGSNVGNAGRVTAVVTADSPELHVVLPPLAAVYLVPEV